MQAWITFFCSKCIFWIWNIFRHHIALQHISRYCSLRRFEYLICISDAGNKIFFHFITISKVYHLPIICMAKGSNLIIFDYSKLEFKTLNFSGFRKRQGNCKQAFYHFSDFESNVEIRMYKSFIILNSKVIKWKKETLL